MIKKINLSLALLLVLNIFSFANGEKESDFHFTENKGQLDSRVKYHTKLHVGDIFFENNTFTFDLYSPEDLDEVYKIRHDKKMRELYANKPVILRKSVYKMNFLNSNSNVFLSTSDNIGYVKNYFRGNDPAKWASDVESFEKLTYNEIYNGISAEIYTKDDHLKYDFTVKAGANPNDILINYEGVTGLILNHGILEISLPNTSVKELKPIAYQEINGKKQLIDCEFVISGTNVSFQFPQGYDNSKELIIDPTWIFSTLTGSTADNWGFTATYDDNDNFYGGGIAFSSGFPVSSGAYDVTFGGVIDAAIIKYNPTGTTRIYATYLGGSQADQPHSLVTNAAGELIVMGATASTNYPTLGAYDASFNGGTTVSPNSATFTGGSDIFITKLNAAGNGIIGSTYLGGTGNDGLSLNTNLMFNYSDENRGEVVIDNNGDIYIASTSNSTNFPTTVGSHKQTNTGNFDAVVSKLTANLNSLLWSTYLGGSSGDAGYSIRVNETNNTVVVCGGTVSNNIGTTPGVINPAYGGATDGYVGVLNNSNGSLNALTYVGTAGYDQAYITEVDKFGNVFTTGQTKGAYPVTGGVYSNPGSSQFIHKMNSSLTTTDFSTVFGRGQNSAVDISITAFLVDNCSNVYVAGWGGSTNNEGTTTGMPVTPGAIKSTTDGSDFYFIVLERDAASLLYGTFFGHNSSDEHVDGGTSRFDKRGTIYQGVCAACGGGNNFPSSPGAYSSTNGSSNCNFGAIKIGLDFQGIIANADDPGDITLCGSPYNVDFSAGSTPPPNTFWDFGDGNTLGVGSDYTPMHTYADTGSYTVMYVAIDSSSCNIADTVYLDVTVINNGTLDAQINIPPYNPCDDSLTIQLEFTGSGADSIYWNMGNGDTFINDTLFNYTYTTGGNYIVTMQAYDFACGGYVTVSDTIYFTPNYTSVNATPPTDQVFCAQPYEVTFDAGATPPPNNYWDFGDGVGTSTLPNINYTYADTGTYTIMYVAIDSSTCNIADTAYYTVQLIIPAELDAQFTIPPYNDCQDSLTINLQFTGTGADSLYWNMGDGTTFINDTAISYTYPPGTYIVQFEAYDLVCNNMETFTDTIDFNPNYTSVNATPPTDQVFCAQPYEVAFDAGATPPPNNYWDFGDGVGTSTLPNLNYTYADTGTYTIMYVAIDSSTCNIADTAYYTVQLIKPAELDAQFTIPPYDNCQTSLTIQLDFTGTGADSLYWDMGNGDTYVDSTSITYTYNTSGTYIVSFEAYDLQCNNNEIFTDTIYFNPTFTTVNATPPVDQVFCAQPYVVTFDAGATPPPNNYWDFGDGVGTSTLPNLNYTYADTGTYTIMYVAIDSSTCNIADTVYYTVQLIKPEELNAQFNIPPYDRCQTTLTVQLDFTGTGADSLYWDMGNGTTFINNTTVNYTYNTPGTYYLEFQAYDFDCNVSEIFRDTIFFNPTTTMVNTVVPPDIKVCGTPLTVNFSSGTPTPPQNYWNFGDGNTSVAINPTHNYADTGSYTVMIVAIDSTTCNIADTAYFNVNLTSAPDLNVNIAYTPPLPCEATNYKVDLAAIGTGADSIYWNMGDGMEFIDSTSISYEYLVAGTYNISVSLFNFFCNRIVTQTKEAVFVELKETTGIIPNVFTPNGDNWNDKLVFVGVDNTQDYSIKIFDRWGRMAYESTDATKHWDGKDASEGTYFYELRYTDVCSSEEKLKTGTVTLLRGPKKQ